MISTAIQQLVNYGLDTGLILPDDEIYIRNQLLMTMQLDDFTAPEGEVCYTDLESILKTLVDDAVARGVCADNSTARDLFDTKLMGVLTPRPSIVRANFEERYESEGPQAATDWFYKFSQDTDYIRRYRIKRDRREQGAGQGPAHRRQHERGLHLPGLHRHGRRHSGRDLKRVKRAVRFHAQLLTRL